MRKVAGATLFTAGLALLVAFGIFMARDWRVQRQQMVERRTTLASVMAANVSAPLIYNDRGTALQVLRSARGIPDVSVVVLYDNAGRPFARYGTGEAAPSVGATRAAWRFGHDSLDVRVPVRVDGQPVGELVLVSTLQELHRTFLAYAVFACFLFLAVGAGVARMGVALARRVLKPVNDLSVAMAAVRQSGDFDQPVEPGRDAELARLAHEFNALLAELSRRNAALVAARDAAETANRLKTEFLANMSHELRTPLNAVLGLTPLLAAAPLTGQQSGFLQVIERSAEDLLQLLNDVLDTAKLEAGRVTLDAVEFDLRRTVRESCAVFKASAKGKGLGFRLTLSPELEPAYVGDPLRLRQILTNLVSNAVKFTAAGEVRVSLEPDAVSGMLKLTVADSGMGVAPEKQGSLFDKFVQADLSTTREFGGTGLGLAICRELVELMDGDIAVDSRPGQGAVFTARFVLQPAEAAVSFEAAPLELAFAG